MADSPAITFGGARSGGTVSFCGFQRIRRFRASAGRFRGNRRCLRNDKPVDTVVETWQGRESLSFMELLSGFMHRVIHTKLGEGRRVAIPSEMCHELGLEPGTPVVLESTDTAIVLRPLDDVVREVQDYFADAAPLETLLSEELSRDRRAEAARDKRG